MASNPVLSRLVSDRERELEKIDEILGAVEDEERDLSDAESELIGRHRNRLEELEPQIVRLVELEEVKERSVDARSLLLRPSTSSGNGNGAPAPAEDPSGPAPNYRTAGEFVVDYLRSRGGMRSNSGVITPPDATAMERMSLLTRAIQNQTTADTPGLLPEPIIGDLLGAISSVQPFISSIGGTKPMGGIPGKTFQRPKITTHVLVGLQSAEKTELPSRKMVIGGVPFTKVTKGGTVDISRQDIDWTVPSAWDALLADLAAVYGEEVENEAADDAVAKATVNTAIPVATNDLAGWAEALYTAAAIVFNASTPHQLPDRIWVSTDVWAQLGPLVDTARLNFPPAAGQGASELGSFTGNLFDLPRIVVPAFPGGTALVGHSSDYEVYEEVVGLLSAVEPALFGVQVAYGGYVAMGAVKPEGMVKLTPPVGTFAASTGRSAKAKE